MKLLRVSLGIETDPLLRLGNSGHDLIRLRLSSSSAHLRRLFVVQIFLLSPPGSIANVSPRSSNLRDAPGWWRPDRAVKGRAADAKFARAGLDRYGRARYNRKA